jgi:tRNA nucleotidyltransferase (CCA-adding enzyme)
LAALQGGPAGPEGTHEECDSLEHTLQVFTALFERRGNDVPALLAAPGHDLGKGETPADVLPSHLRHDERGVPVARGMRKRLGLDRDLRGAMSAAANVHMRVGRIEEMNAGPIIDLAEALDGSPLSVDQVIDLGAADAEGREPAGDFPEAIARRRLEAGIQALDAVDGVEALNRRGFEPEDVGDAIEGERVCELVRADRAQALADRLADG